MKTDKVKRVLLMQLGARAVEGDPSSGLKERGAGGLEYIRKLTEIEFPGLPFRKIIHAPSPLAAATAEAIIGSARDLLWTSAEDTVVKESGMLFPDEKSMPGWLAISNGLPKNNPRFADLRKAISECVDQSKIGANFLSHEAGRIFQFIESELTDIPEGETMLCLTPSPLPEAMVLWLREARPHPRLKLRDIGRAHMLNHLDGFILFYKEGILADVALANYRKKVRTRVFEEAVTKALKEKDRGAYNQAFAAAADKYGLPLEEIEDE
ncbi:MAG: hypothetical protein HYW91_01245 [Candidatus Sungbacteria bacterium]|nr:hypothetical protein [Candidatus Sungbacteria bacterium]